MSDGQPFEKVLSLLTEINNSVHDVEKGLGELRGDMETALTDTNGRMKGNFELMDKSLDNLMKQDQLQHEIIIARTEALEKDMSTKADSLQKQIDANRQSVRELYDLDRESKARQEEFKSAVLSQVDDKITGLGSRVDEIFDKIEARLERSDSRVDTLSEKVAENEGVAGENRETTRAARGASVGVIIALIPIVLTGIAYGAILWGRVEALERRDYDVRAIFEEESETI